MEKFSKKIISHRKVIIKYLISILLILFPLTIVLTISTLTFKINYVIANYKTRLEANKIANYKNLNVKSEWNLNTKENFLPQPKKRIKDNDQINNYHQANTLNFNWGNDDQWKNKNDRENFKKNRHENMALVCDSSNSIVLDKSFTQSLYHGLVQYINNDNTIDHNQLKNDGENSAYWTRPTQDSSLFFQSIYDEVAKKHKVIHLCGFNHITPLNSIGEIKENNDGKKYKSFNSNFGDAAYILYDGDISNNQNIASVSFRADQSAFLTGIACCVELLKNAEIYHENGREMSIGIFGGVMIPTVLVFMGGIERGIELFNKHILPNIIEQIINDDPDTINDFPNLKKTTKLEWKMDNKDKLIEEFAIKIISLGKQSSHFSGSFICGDAIGLVKQFLNRDASAIIPVAGPQIVDAVNEIQNQNAKCFVIGVDTACENGDIQKTAFYKDKTIDKSHNSPKQCCNIIKFSALKNIGHIAKKQNELLRQNLNWSGGSENKPDEKESICSIGFRTNANILNGGSHISYDGWYFVMQGLKYLDPDNGKGFNEVWNEACKKFNEKSDKKIKEFDNAYNFNDKEVYKNYDIYGELLGKILNKHKISFRENETINIKNRTTTILDWLDENMYFIA